MAKRKSPQAGLVRENGQGEEKSTVASKKIKLDPPLELTTKFPEPKDQVRHIQEAVNTSQPIESGATPTTIQVVVGSYDRVLHGITATIYPPTTTTRTAASTSGRKTPPVEFADSFLFTAHTSAIKALALSPPSKPVPGQHQKLFLASGSVDERINVYHISAHLPKHSSKRDLVDAAALSGLSPRPVLQNLKNRELGVLFHHSGPVTCLSFPTRGKLMSGSIDSTVAVTRTRDWNLLSSIRVPKPKLAGGRPAGDTITADAIPVGVNGFAVHPSMKIMITVSAGERCMRLWNLVTGKKAGVLNFGKELLIEIGERGYGSGEGKDVVWGSSVDAGEEFSVVFRKEVIVFGMDSRVRCRVLGTQASTTMVHRARYIVLDAEKADAVLAVSTGDGRVVFFSTAERDLFPSPSPGGNMRVARQFAQLGGKDVDSSVRIKDFEILDLEDDAERSLLVVTGSADGSVRLWRVGLEGLRRARGEALSPVSCSSEDEGNKQKDETETKTRNNPRQVGEMMGKYETDNRITCLAAFVMIPRPEGLENNEDEEKEGEDDESSKEGSAKEEI